MPGNMNNLMKQAQRTQRQMCIRDRIVAAANEAFRQMEAESSEAMSKLTGGLGGALGGGFPF